MKIKSIATVLIFLLLFFGDIAISFSFKREVKRNMPSTEISPLSFKLSNTISSNALTHPFDSAIMDFLSKKRIKAASVAVAKDGRLVYAKGFGYSNEESQVNTEPRDLFRIASVSKLITAVAIMKLYEEGMLDLNDKVFGKHGLLNDSLFLNYKDKRAENITVYHLLNHTAGWNNKRYDPVFNTLTIARKLNVKPPASVDQIIYYTLLSDLDYKPGGKYCYSNFGYVLLGRIIEKISKMPYEEYVKFALLQPLGIYDMHIGYSFYNKKFPNEVNYYQQDRELRCYAYDGSGKKVSVMYGGNDMQLLGAAGGWLASAPELLKLIVAIDGFSSKPDILTQESINKMTNFGKSSRRLIGWRGSDGYGTWWRTGTLAGTSALVMRHKNQTCWVMILNTSTHKKMRIHNEMSRTMHSALYKIKNWPEYDLFNYMAVDSEKMFTQDTDKAF